MFQILTGFKQIFTSSSNIHPRWEFLLLTHPEDLLVSSQLSMSTKSSCSHVHMNQEGTKRIQLNKLWIFMAPWDPCNIRFEYKRQPEFYWWTWWKMMGRFTWNHWMFRTCSKMHKIQNKIIIGSFEFGSFRDSKNLRSAILTLSCLFCSLESSKNSQEQTFNKASVIVMVVLLYSQFGNFPSFL